MDSVITEAAPGKLEAGQKHQVPLKAPHIHGGVVQGQPQRPEADYCPQEPGLHWGQWQGPHGTEVLEEGILLHSFSPLTLKKFSILQ